MRRFVNPGKRIASFTRTFARMRWALMFDGVGIRGVLANRAINPDGDIDIEWEQRHFTLDGVVRSVVAQSISSNFLESEFRLSNVNTNRLNLLIGGNSVDILTVAQGWSSSGKFRFTLVGNNFTVYKGGAVVNTGTFSRGSAREPTAQTMLGVQLNGAGVYYRYWVGLVFNVKINGTLWPIADRNQSIQLPEPSGLGAELNSGVISSIQTGWTYADGVLTAVDVPPNQPSTSFNLVTALNEGERYVLQFDLAVQMGGVRFQVVGGPPVNGSPEVTSGMKSYIVTANAGNVRLGFQAVASGYNTFSIKNISFKPLGTANPMTISNATSANWGEVSV